MLLRRNRKFVGTRERLKRIVATFDSREANSDETHAQHADTRWFRAVASRAARNMGTRGQGSIPVNPWCQRSDRPPTSNSVGSYTEGSLVDQMARCPRGGGCAGRTCWVGHRHVL